MTTWDFGIIGPGRLGSALAVLLTRAGWRFVGACGRTTDGAQRLCRTAGSGRAFADAADLARDCRLTLITTPDDAIASTCRDIARRNGFTAGAVVAHCSGVLTSAVLDPARNLGAHTGSLHPLQSFATAGDAAARLGGCYCCIEGDDASGAVLRCVAEALHMHVLHVPTASKPLYHAGAVAASNFLVALQDIAQELATTAGIDPDTAASALLSLARGTLDNIDRLGVCGALTGPFARGDRRTIRLHLEHIRTHCPDILPAYGALGLRALELGVARGGVDERTAQDIRQLIGPP